MNIMYCPFCVREIKTSRSLSIKKRVYHENLDYYRTEVETAICDDCARKLTEIVNNMRDCQTEEEWLKTEPLFIHKE